MVSERPDIPKDMSLSEHVEDITLRGNLEDITTFFKEEAYLDPQHVWEYSVDLDSQEGVLYCRLLGIGELTLEISLPGNEWSLMKFLEKEYPDPEHFREVYVRTASKLTLLRTRSLKAPLPNYHSNKKEVLSHMYFKVQCIRSLRDIQGVITPVS